MLFKNLLALLIAGAAVVTATNNTDTNSTSSSSSSASTTGSSSSSSAATTTGSSSSSSAATTTGSSSSSAATTTGSSSSASTPSTGSSSASTPSTGSSSATTTANTTATTATAPKAVKVVKASMNIQIAIPEDATPEKLLSDTSFKGAFECEVSNIAFATTGDSCDKTKVTVTKFMIGAAGRRQLSGNATVSSKKLITAEFTIKATDANVASIKTKMTDGNALTGIRAGLDTRAKAGTLKVGTATITVDLNYTPAYVSDPSEATVDEIYTGQWQIAYYSKAGCASADMIGSEAHTGMIGTKKDVVVVATTTTTTCIEVKACIQSMGATVNTGAGVCGSATLSSKTDYVDQGGCVASGSNWFAFECPKRTEMSSDASARSVVGIIAGLVMGFVSLV